MRHRNGLRKLNRTSSHREAMLRNMCNSLIEHEAIKTTVPKAKELRRVVEPLITLGKNDSLAGRRRAFSQLRDDEVVRKLFEDIGPRFKARAGGYTRILKMEPRPGDAAPMALMQLVEKAGAQAEAEQPKKAAKKPARKKAAPAAEGEAKAAAKPRRKKAAAG